MQGLTNRTLSEFLEPIDIYRGRMYWLGYIKYDKKEISGDRITHTYKVESESSPSIYDVKVTLNKGNIERATCTCMRYHDADSCKHVAAVLLSKYEEMKRMSLSNTELSDQILSLFYNGEEKARKVKKELKLTIDLSFDTDYYGTILIPNIKIGYNKMYNFNNKARKFYEVYDGEAGEFIFGKEFTYNKDEYFFNTEDEKIIEFLRVIKIKNESNYYRRNELLISSNDISRFLDLIKDKTFTINGRKYTGIRRENPYETSLKKEKDTYKFSIKNSSNYEELTPDYVVSDGELYEVPKDVVRLKRAMNQNGLTELEFKDDNLEKFSKGILKEVKDNIKLDKTVEDKIIIASKPKSKLYFDFHYDKIVCDIKLIYKDKEINYFDNTPDIVRDIDYENEILDTLNYYNFIIENNTIFIEDIDQIGEFLETNLAKLTEKYDVYTSQNLKNTKIKKDIQVSSTFSIGQDNIMKYEFNLGEISNEDLVGVLEQIKKKKRYYKLKSGDLIDLEENNELKELDNLIDNMNLDSKSIKKGEGEIPKYRAIYLDSLKNKYSIVKTNNLFDELIDNFNEYKDSKISLNTKDKKILRDYQVTGVKWLYNIYKCGFGSILADEMGLGKSIQLIYFIKEVLKEKEDAKILIIAPTSLIYNWENEFDKFGSELKYKVVAGIKNKRLEFLNDIKDTNILITTYGLIREDKDIYKEINFEVIAIDEAQNIKNNMAQMTKTIKSLKGNAKFALTGTPLENSVGELWSIFDFIMPGYLTNLESFHSKYNIKDVDEDNLKSLDSLKEQIKPFILRRKKKEVVKELPDKIENNIFLELTSEQKKLYAAELQKTQKELDELIGTEGFSKARFKILQLLTRLRQICIDPSLAYEDYHGGATKIVELIPIVKGIIENGHKILLFSTYKSAIDIVNRELTNNDISCYVIDGSVSSKKRMELVNKFNNDDTNVFLITLKAGGTGLNLTSADVVIHLDLWWNPQAENQATDRAPRIGQKNTVDVIKLVCKGTIEEKILDLQKKKKILSDTLIEGEDRDKMIISKLSEKDIKNLLSMDNDED